MNVIATVGHGYTYRKGQKLAVADLEKPKRTVVVYGLKNFAGGQRVRVFQHTDGKWYAL